MNKKIIYLDFDGTVVEHQWPMIGEVNPNAIQVIKKLIEAGHTVILNTMRSEFNDGSLEHSIEYLKTNGIDIESTTKKLHPRIYNLDEDIIFLDDIGFKMPLCPTLCGNFKMVDWNKVEADLIKKGIIKE